MTNVISKTTTTTHEALFSTQGENVSLDIAELDSSSVDSVGFVDTKPKMEFNIGVFGTVSAGKSTLINSIFGKHFSQMNIRRTTMVPQRYQLVSSCQESADENIQAGNSASNLEFQDKLWDGQTILHHEVEFPVDFIDEKQSGDFQYNIYDFPGINDQSTKQIYTNWVRDHVNMFDIIVFVVDIHSGLNTSDEIEILDLFLEGMSNNEHTRLVVLANKCDDLVIEEDGQFTEQDEEKLTIYTEQICPTIHQRALNHRVDDGRIRIMPISARSAFIYRTINANHDDVMSHLDQKHLGEMIQNEIGKTKWVRMSEKQRQDHIGRTLENIVGDTDVYISNMQHSGFTRFRTLLNEVTSNPNLVLPFYTVNIQTLLDEITLMLKSPQLDQVCASYQKLISIIDDLSTTLEVKQTLIDKVLGTFEEHMLQLEIITDLPAIQESYGLFINPTTCVLFATISIDAFLDTTEFSSSLEAFGMSLLTRIVSYLSTEAFKTLFNPTSFMYSYDSVLEQAIARYMKDNITNPLDMIPIPTTETKIWNEHEYLEWLFSKLHSDTRPAICQALITAQIKNMDSSVSIEPQLMGLFYHYAMSHDCYNTLTFQNQCIIREALMRNQGKGCPLIELNDDYFETLESEMMRVYGNFFDILCDHITEN